MGLCESGMDNSLSGFQDRPRPHLATIFDRCQIVWYKINITDYVKYNYCCYNDVINDATVRFCKFSAQNVGIAVDDSLYHIIVLSDSSALPSKLLGNH